MVSLKEYNQKFRPDYIVPGIRNVPFAKIGVPFALFDLDGTLLQGNLGPRYLDTYPVKHALSEQLIHGGGIISNTVVPDGRWGRPNARVAVCAAQFGFPFECCLFRNRKPRPDGYVRLMRKIGPDCRPDTTVMVGDQLSDIAGAKTLGMRTVLVIGSGGDHWATSLLKRPRERKLLMTYDEGRYVRAQNQLYGPPEGYSRLEGGGIAPDEVIVEIVHAFQDLTRESDFGQLDALYEHIGEHRDADPDDSPLDYLSRGIILRSEDPKTRLLRRKIARLLLVRTGNHYRIRNPIWAHDPEDEDDFVKAWDLEHGIPPLT